MRIARALAGVTRLGVDTPPFIYYVEDRAPYADLCTGVFERIADGSLTVRTSILTLTETLVHPLRNADGMLENEYRALLLGTAGIAAVPLDAPIAADAADLRARYGLRTPDAVQVASAIRTGCQAFLSNDRGLRRVTELRMLVLDDLTL